MSEPQLQETTRTQQPFPLMGVIGVMWSYIGIIENRSCYLGPRVLLNHPDVGLKGLGFTVPGLQHGSGCKVYAF